jgi:hypothetical protein
MVYGAAIQGKAMLCAMVLGCFEEICRLPAKAFFAVRSPAFARSQRRLSKAKMPLKGKRHSKNSG